MVDSRSPSQVRTEIADMHRRMQSLNHFEILGVEKHTPYDQIHTQYVAMARKWHSDAFAGIELGPSKTQLDEIFQRIAEAHEILSDSDAKSEYLTLLNRQEAGMSTDVQSILRGETKADEGIAELKRKRWTAAEAAFDEAISLNPDDPLIWAHRAWAQYRRKENTPQAAQAAKVELERALNSQNNLPDACRYLGTICFEQDQLDKAIYWLKICVKLSPQDIDAARLLRLARSRQQKQKQSNEGILARILGLLGR